MPDISLLWYDVNPSTVRADRNAVRAAAVRLEIPGQRMSRSAEHRAFRAAAATVHTFTGTDGKTHTCTGKPGRSTDDFTTYLLVRDDGHKMAEWKYFAPRKVGGKVVAGTHDVRSVIRNTQPWAETHAAREWLVKATAAYEATASDVPTASVVSITQDSLEEVAIPLLSFRSSRTQAYFLYDDDFWVVDRTRAFLQEVTAGVRFTVIGLDDDGDRAPLAESADLQMARRLDTQLKRIRAAVSGLEETAAARGRRRTQLRSDTGELRRLVERHERRLRLPLPRSRDALTLADQAIRYVPKTAILPKVKR